MIAEFVRAITAIEKEKQAAELAARAPKKIGTSADGRKELYEHNGQLIERDVTPPNRHHDVDTVADMIAAATKWGDKKGVIWIDSARLQLVIDDEDRRDTVTLVLAEGSTFSYLRALEERVMTQADLIRILRTKLVNANGRELLLTAIRKIRFKNHLSGVSNVQHGNESMGQTIENEVTGADELPDSLTVDTYVYCNLGETDQQWPIKLDLEIDAKNQRFRLTPVGDEIERVSQAALASIRERIEAELPDYPIFYGQP